MKGHLTRSIGLFVSCLMLAACSGSQAGTNVTPVAMSATPNAATRLSAASPSQPGLVIENRWSSPIDIEEQSVGCFAYGYDGQTSLSIASRSKVFFTRNSSCDVGPSFRADGRGVCRLHISFLSGKPAAFNIAEDGRARCNWEWPPGGQPTFIYDR
jgi:hypothetical protein